VAEPGSVLVVFAHPALERARVNPALIQAADTVSGVAIRDLYELYPDLTVDVAAEQKALRAARSLVLQFPLYWYSAPALLKEWFDLVLTSGFAYGPDGTSLKGKTMTCAVTAAGKGSIFHARGNGLSPEEVVRPFQGIAAASGMRWIEPFVVTQAQRLEASGIARESARYQRYLEGLAD